MMAVKKKKDDSNEKLIKLGLCLVFASAALHFVRAIRPMEALLCFAVAYAFAPKGVQEVVKRGLGKLAHALVASAEKSDQKAAPKPKADDADTVEMPAVAP
jgi:hypothetical protein